MATADILERQRVKSKRYCEKILGKKFCIPTELSDTAANAIALATILGGGSEVWLEGEMVSLKKLKLEIRLAYRSEPEKI